MVQMDKSKPDRMQVLAYVQGDNTYMSFSRKNHRNNEQLQVRQKKQEGVTPAQYLSGAIGNLDPVLEAGSDGLYGSAGYFSGYY